MITKRTEYLLAQHQRAVRMAMSGTLNVFLQWPAFVASRIEAGRRMDRIMEERRLRRS